jgi:hypothetical protein
VVEVVAPFGPVEAGDGPESTPYDADDHFVTSAA